MRKLKFIHIYDPPRTHNHKLGKFFLFHDDLAYNHHQLWRLHDACCPIQKLFYSKDYTKMADWKFYNKKLNANEKKAFQLWCEKNDADMPDIIASVLIAGYKWSISADPLNEVYTASLTPSKHTKVNKGGSLTGKHSDYWTAGLVVIFKHVVICDQGSWEDMLMDNKDWG